jgi:hypothetical protein
LRNIVFSIDGPDGVGKSSAIGELVNIFPNLQIKKAAAHPKLVEPLFEVFSGKYEDYDPHYLQLLLSASYSRVLEEATSLAQYYPVVLDRCYASTLSYGLAEGLEREWLEALIKPLFKPDLVFILLGGVFSSSNPSIYDVNEELQEKVIQNYLDLSSFYRWKIVYNIEGGDVRSPEEIAGEIAEYLILYCSKEHNLYAIKIRDTS